MKSKPNAVLLLAALLIAAAAGAVGWMARGLFTGRASSQSATAPPTAEISRTGSSSAASPTSQHPGGLSAEEPKVVAKRLLQAVLDGTQETGSEDLLRFRFQHALARCDESAVAEMVETISGYVKNPDVPHFSANSLPGKLCVILLNHVAVLNPPKALEVQIDLATAGLTFMPDDFSLVMGQFSQKDLAAGQEMIEGLPLGDTRAKAQIALWKARSNSDPEGVFQSLMNLDSSAKDSILPYSPWLPELFEELATQAPEKALQVADLFPGAHFSETRHGLLIGWLERDSKAAVQWALEQNDAGAIMTCLVNLPSENRDLDEKSLRDNFSSISSRGPAAQSSLARKLAERLAEQDIPEGVRWAATLQEDARDAAHLAVAEAWIKQDAPAAAEWLATWPAGGAKNVAVELLTDAIVKDDPESALAWAASIQAKKRYGLMQKALDTLTAKDPAAAERAKQTLSEEDRAVLSVIKRKGFGE